MSRLDAAYPGQEAVRRVDARLDAGGRQSLAPDRARATPLDAVVRTLLAAGPASEEEAAALAGAAAAVGTAILESFPDNVFWDLDALLAGLWQGRLARPDAPAAELQECAATLVELQGLFGAASAIRFRYAHDFLFGFDWSRWVRRDPAARAAVGPFDRAFLDRMRGRGAELLALVASDDRVYPRLREPGHRNPFAFSREPEDEARLHRDLARLGLLPVRAWELAALGAWDRPYTELRLERAKALGLDRAAG